MATREITDSRTVIGVNALASRSLVVDRDLSAPPGSCADRANYLVASSAIGAWAGQDGKLATAIGTNAVDGWVFQTVETEGTSLFIQDESTDILFDGTKWINENWSLIDTNGAPISSGATWTYSSPVANVDIINLGVYSELEIIARDVSASVSGNRAIRLSVNNGSTFFSSSGDYVAVDNNGVEATTTALLFHATATASARSIAGRITGINSFGPKYGAGIGDLSGQNRLFVASNSPVNAIRFENAGGGNLTAGSLFVKARR